MQSLEIICVIPARGGSKGIPRKNLYLLNGKPLVAYSIEEARKTRNINRVIVSTDDEEIAEVSRKYGAETIKRPVEISGDLDSSESALLHALKYLHENEAYEPDILVLLQCTAPLTLSEDIDGTIEALVKNNADSALSVTPFHYFLWKYDENNNAIGINHDKNIRYLRQQQAPQFLETGSVYAMKTKGFREAKIRFYGKTVMYEIPKERCLEIDEISDLKLIEHILKTRSKY